MARRRYRRYRRPLRRRRLRPRRLRRSRMLLRRRRYRNRRNGVAPARVGFTLQYPVNWALYVGSNGTLDGQNSVGLSNYSQPAWSLMLKHPTMIQNLTEPGPYSSPSEGKEWHLYPDWEQAPAKDLGTPVNVTLKDLMKLPPQDQYFGDSQGTPWKVGDAST